MRNYTEDGVQQKPRIRSWQNFHPEIDGDPETILGKSMTVPGMTLSMREIVTRFRRGDTLPSFESYFDGDDPIPDVNRMDKIEIIEMLRANNDVIDTIQSELSTKANKAKSEKQAAEQAEFSRLKEFEKAHQKSDPPQ